MSWEHKGITYTPVGGGRQNTVCYILIGKNCFLRAGAMGPVCIPTGLPTN